MNLKLLLNPCRSKFVGNKLVELDVPDTINCGLLMNKSIINKCSIECNDDDKCLKKCSNLIKNYNNSVRIINNDVFNRLQYYKECIGDCKSNLTIDCLKKNNNKINNCCNLKCSKNMSKEECNKFCTFKHTYLTEPKNNVLCNKKICYIPDVLLYDGI